MIEPVVIHESSDWLVLNKPAGWHSIAPSQRQLDVRARAGGEQEPDVESWLRERFEWARTLEEAGLVHRLDLETTGCLAVAKSARAYERLCQEFAHSLTSQKTYLAEVQSSEGVHDGRFQLYFTSRYKRSSKVTVSEHGAPGTQGVCEWRIVARDGGLARLRIELIGPGRRHQIRAGFAHLSMPIVGDLRYGGPPSRDGLLHLHAWQVELEGETVACPPPW